MSEEFFLSSPHLKSRPYRPMTTRGTAINGTKVMTLGIVNVAFRIRGRFHTANFRVVRGLVQNIFLGWDWFSRSGAMINPDKGTVDFPRYGDSVPLVPESFGVSGSYYHSNEDVVVPANSKMICNVEVMLNGLDGVSNVVATEPFNNSSSDLWASRNISTVRDGMFATEFINPQEYPIKIIKGRVLGYAQFTSDEELTAHSVRTELFCHYGSDPPEGDDSPADEDAQEEIEEIENHSGENDESDEPPRKMRRLDSDSVDEDDDFDKDALDNFCCCFCVPNCHRLSKLVDFEFQRSHLPFVVWEKAFGVDHVFLSRLEEVHLCQVQTSFFHMCGLLSVPLFGSFHKEFGLYWLLPHFECLIRIVFETP